MTKKKPKTPKHIWVIFQSNPAEREALHAGAALCGYPNLSSFLRAAAFDKIQAELPRENRHG